MASSVRIGNLEVGNQARVSAWNRVICLVTLQAHIVMISDGVRGISNRNQSGRIFVPVYDLFRSWFGVI
jgi:hypothetical protein